MLATLLAAILPALAVLAVVEVSLRSCGKDAPHYHTTVITGGAERIHQEDDLLFFALKPGIDVAWQGVRNKTNSLGLRSPEIGPKQEREFRVLSLGESSTYGARVESHQTYSARLEDLLGERDPSRPYLVINAGVQAYSSFQSLLYLRERGIELEPDMVLFYHEVNDYLPSSVRAAALMANGAGNERSLALSDRELYRSRRLWLGRMLMRNLALARVIADWRGRNRLEGLEKADVFPHDAALEVPEGSREVHTRQGLRDLNLPPRVTQAERVQILDELVAFCKAHELLLVVIHPSYAWSKRHECELTDFCAGRGVPLVEVYDALHPDGIGPTLFMDAYHPRAEGHDAIARAILTRLVSERLLPRRPLPQPKLPSARNRDRPPA